MLAIVLSALALAVFGAHFIVPKTIWLPNIGLYTAIAAGITAAVGVFSLVNTPPEDINEHTKATYLAIIGLLAVLLYDTGPFGSPFMALWGAASLAAATFGLWGILPVAAIDIGLPLFLAFKGQMHYTDVWATAGLALLPLLLGFILRPAATAGQTDEDKSYHILAKELSQASGKADVVINAIGEGVLAVNGQGVVELINPAAIQIVGWGKEDAVGLNYKSILKLVNNKGDEADPAHDPVARTFSTNTTTTDNTLSLLTQSGKKLLVAVQASPLGQPGSGAIIVFRDITGEKSEERQQAEFISTASHEMRTPVAEIEGYLGLVLNPATAQIDEKARDFVTKAHNAAEHLGRLFQDLLDVSKAEDGRMQSKPKVVDAVKFMSDVVESLRPKAQAKGLILTFNSSGSDTHQHGIGRSISPSFYTNVDNDHLREVADNLVENAIKYTPKGQVTVTVEGNDQTVKIGVTDTGLGIPREDIAHLFQKFYRVDNTATREIGGTGLGLYLCRRLIEGMNGRIWVDSTFGQGSTFYVELPRTSSVEASRMIQQVEQESVALPTAEPAGTPVAPESVLPPDDLVAAIAEPEAPIAPAPQAAVQAPTPEPQAPIYQPVAAAPAAGAPYAAQPIYAQPAPVPAPVIPAAPEAQPLDPSIPHPISEHPNTPLASIEQDPRAYIAQQTEGRSLNVPVRNG